MTVIRKLHRTQRTFTKRLSQAFSVADLPAHDVACPDCGSTVALPEIANGSNANCPVCNHQLVSIPYSPYFNPIAYASASLVFMFLAFSFVFMGIRVGEASFTMTLSQAVATLLKKDYEFLANILLGTLFITPILLLLGSLYVHQALYFKKNRPFLRQAINLIIHIKPWVMIDIFVISVFVSMVKIKSLASMNFGYSFWAVILLVLCLMRTSIFVHPHWLYYQYKKLKSPHFNPLPAQNNQACRHCFFFNPKNKIHCQVCQHKLSTRKPRSLQITLALLLGAVALYVPANYYPMMITVTPLTTTAANILDGIIYMWDTDAKFIATVIFCASLVVPLVKMFAIVILLISVKFKPLASAIILTRLYRIIEFIGRWSMIDVFVVTIMVTLVQLPGAFALPGKAVLYFCLVVILSMIAVTEFDIRLIWDKIKEKEAHE